MINLSPRDELTLLIGAFRYYLGRQTYGVSDFCDLLVNWWPYLSDRAKGLIERELEEAFQKDKENIEQGISYSPLGMDIDKKEWERIRRLYRGVGNG